MAEVVVLVLVCWVQDLFLATVVAHQMSVLEVEVVPRLVVVWALDDQHLRELVLVYPDVSAGYQWLVCSYWLDL